MITFRSIRWLTRRLLFIPPFLLLASLFTVSFAGTSAAFECDDSCAANLQISTPAPGTAPPGYELGNQYYQDPSGVGTRDFVYIIVTDVGGYFDTRDTTPNGYFSNDLQITFPSDTPVVANLAGTDINSPGGELLAPVSPGNFPGEEMPCVYNPAGLFSSTNSVQCDVPEMHHGWTLLLGFWVTLPVDQDSVSWTASLNVNNDMPAAVDGPQTFTTQITHPDLSAQFADPANPPATVTPGTGFNYNVTFQNVGPAGTPGPVDATIQLPVAGLSSAGVNSTTDGTCTYHHPTFFDQSRSVTCTFDPIKSGGQVVVSVGATASSNTGSYATTATIDTGNVSGDENPSNNTASITTNVVNDTTPPGVNVTPDRGPDSNGWYNHPVTVSPTATDPDNSPSQLTCDAPTTYGGPDSANASVTESCTDPAGNTGSATLGFQYDATPPVVTDAGFSSGTLGHNGWYVSPVTEAFTASDATSGLADCPGSFTRSSTSQGSAVTISSGPCPDNAGNTNPGVTSGAYQIDTTRPYNVTFTGGGLTNGASYYFGLVPAGPTGCTASDDISGFDHCDITGYGTSAGTHTVTATAYDVAGNSAAATITYTVQPWTLTGFYPPVNMTQTWNGVKSGSTVPLKFNVYQGPAGPTTMLSATADISQPLTATQVSCADESTITTDTATATGATSLRWDPTANQFVYNWATPGNQAGTCWFVTMTTIDGSHLTASFKLTR